VRPVRSTLRSAAVFACLAVLGASATAGYTVRPGDTLSGIAAKLGVGVQDLARANAISDPNHLVAGRTLQVPSTSASASGVPPLAKGHVVASGENLTTISRRYGVSVADLAAANRLDPGAVLRAGVRLAVPASPVASGTGLPARLAASPQRLAYIPLFKKWAAANGLPADLLMATTWLESGWQNHVVSSVGAVGIGQLMPETTTFICRDLIGIPRLDPNVPENNIRMSARFLRFLLEKTGGDARMALAGYYQGLRSVRTVGMYPGTVLYVDGVLALRSRFRV
jgi:N-acetylmuramoyl-L-alanine amidase